MNDAGGATGDAGGKIVLLDEQSALAGAGAFAGHGYAVDASADHHHLEVLAFQWRPGFDC